MTAAADQKAAPAACRKCGCTDADCSGCISRTGVPCYWVEPGLCSACASFANTEALGICARRMVPGVIVVALDQLGALQLGIARVDDPISNPLVVLADVIDRWVRAIMGGQGTGRLAPRPPVPAERARCIHCQEEVCAAADVDAVRLHASTCAKSPVAQELQRMRSVFEQALVVAEHWTHDGVSGTELDKLLQLVHDKCCANCGAELHQEPEVGLGPGCNECHWVSGRAIASRRELLDVIARLEHKLEEYSHSG